MTGCARSGDSEDTIGETAFHSSKGKITDSSSEPLTIRLAVNDTYCINTACECVHYLASREYEELQAKLKSVYRIDLELTYFIDEYELTDALLSRKYDGAICKPWFGFMLVPEYGMKYTRIADILDPFENQMLRGMFLVKKDSPIKTFSEVTGKRVAMGREDSFEKYHLPMRLMAKQKIRPGQLFHKASCTESISMLLDDSADVAVVSDYSLIAGCATDLGKEEDFRIIAETDKIPLVSLIVDRLKVSDAEALRLQKALLELSGDNSPKSMISRGFVKPAKWTPVMYSE